MSRANSGDYRPQRGDEQCAQAGRDGGAERQHRADPRRNRHRQRAYRPRYPQPQRTQRSADGEDELRGDARRAAGERSLESDLFGHERGAFTGASAQRIGRFELADKSSLFLDEVGDMPLELQPKLLRVLQEQEFERLGSNKLIQTDVRLIAATNRDLKQMVIDREFRSDLYYRLNVFPIHLPPLRERPDDIPLLVKAFTFKIARRMGRNIDSIPAETLRTLTRMEWPGNVRELENVIERAVLLTRGNVLQLSLPERDIVEAPRTPAVLPEEGEDEYQLIVRVLKESNGVVAGPKGAAQRLGLKRTTLLSRMKRLGINKDELV